MNVIQIEIKNKIAELSAPALIVCGNSDYVVEFNFDEEWDEHPIRTARFSTWKGFTDVVFEGSQCPVPVLSNASYVKIGVFAGDLRTTTPAYIPCKKSILCEGGAPIEPTPDVYAQLIAMIESGMVKGEQGEKGEKGEKGDAGSIKFIPVAELPTEGIDESAIYIIPDPDGAEENRFIEYVYIADSWEVLGKISIQVDHSEYVKKDQYANGQRAGLVRSNPNGGAQISEYGEGLIYLTMAEEKEIINKVNRYKPIVPENLDYAMMAGLANCLKPELWTDDTTDENGETVQGAKTKARELLGAVGKTESATKDKLGLVLKAEANHVNTYRYGYYVDAYFLPIGVRSFLVNPPAHVDWTDENKTKACETLGALPLSGGTMTGEIVLGQGDNKGINLGNAGVINSGLYTVLGFVGGNLVIGSYRNQTVLRTLANGKLKVQFGDASGTVENVATEKYVDDLIANLQAQIDELKGS